MIREKRTVRLMGTTIDINIKHNNAKAVVDAIINRLITYEHRFSANDPQSELMMINQQAGRQPVKVNQDLFELIKIGKAHSCSLNSNLNIAIGPLVQAWRIGFANARVPVYSEIDDLLAKTDPKKIILDEDNTSVFLKEQGMSIDLGCLAKGYIADLIIDHLKRLSVHSALINLGGNVVVYGPAREESDSYWHIGIQHPFYKHNQPLMVLKVFNQSVVTSGIYERTLTVDNQTYHHILDPSTGYPIDSDVASLTIVSTDSCSGEVWTTRLFGKPIDEILSTVEQHDGIEALIVTLDGTIHYTDGLKQFIA